MNLQHIAQFIIEFMRKLDGWKFEIGTVSGQLYIISFRRILELIFMTTLVKSAIQTILGLDSAVERSND